MVTTSSVTAGSKLVDYLVTQFKAAHGIDLTKDKMAMRTAKTSEKPEDRTIEFNQTSINLPYITVDAEKNPCFSTRRSLELSSSR